MAMAGGLYLWQQRDAAAEPASIAVLPFRNLGTGDPYLAEGIGEEILGQLVASHISVSLAAVRRASSVRTLTSMRSPKS